MKRVIIFLLAAIVTLSAVSQDPISRPGKKKQNTTQTTNTSQKRQKQEAEKRRKAKEEQERKEQEERERLEREEQERLAREEQARREREEQERIAKEEQAHREREEQERKAKEERERRKREEQVRKVREASGSVNGYDYVDLGLSVKWATKNVGASSPSDYGDYYAWGETIIKSEYEWSNCKNCGKKKDDITGNSKYDVARSKWGSSWRMPTKAEFEELINNCDWEIIAIDNHNGYLVTSKITDKSIFIPLTGSYKGASIEGLGEEGHYWSSTSSFNLNFSYQFFLNPDKFGMFGDLRDHGLSVRPVVE